MENLYDFNSFLDKKNSIKENELVSNYLNDKISSKEFDYQFNNQIINENISDWLKKGLDWIMGIFKSIMDSPEAYILKEEGKKVFNVLRKVLDYIKKFKEKHPFIYECIIIFLIVLLIFIATVATTYASDPEYSKLVINTAIGFIDSIHDDPTNIKYTDFDLMEAKAYLISLRDGGEAAKYTFSETAIKLSKTALDIINNSITEYKVTHNDSLGMMLGKWFDTGSHMIIVKLEELSRIGGLSKNIVLGTTP